MPVNTIKVFDLTGRQMNVPAALVGNKWQIDVKLLSPGVYNIVCGMLPGKTIIFL